MKAVYGAIHHSPAAIADKLKAKGIKSIIVSSRLESRKQVTASVVVFTGYRFFKSNARFLEKWKGVVIITDSPLRLYETPNIKILDGKRSLSWSISLEPLKLNSVIKTLKSNVPNIAINWRKEGLLVKQIQRIREGKFLDKFNNAIYAVTNHETRDQYKKAITDWLVSTDGADGLYNRLVKKPRKGAAKAALNEIVDFIEKNPNFREGLRECVSSKTKQINYKSIGKRFKVDTYELNYLVKAYKTKVSKAKTLEQLAAEHRKKYADKKKSQKTE